MHYLFPGFHEQHLSPGRESEEYNTFVRCASRRTAQPNQLTKRLPVAIFRQTIPDFFERKLKTNSGGNFGCGNGNSNWKKDS